VELLFTENLDEKSRRSIDLFVRVRPPQVSQHFEKIYEVITSSQPQLRWNWKWGTVFICLENKDICYLKTDGISYVTVSFVQGAKLKQQQWLQGQDKVFVRHLDVNLNKDFEKKFATLLAEAVNIADAHPFRRGKSGFSAK
jgi:hypothetical protein